MQQAGGLDVGKYGAEDLSGRRVAVRMLTAVVAVETRQVGGMEAVAAGFGGGQGKHGLEVGEQSYSNIRDL